MEIKFLTFSSIRVIIGLLTMNFLLIGCKNKKAPSTEHIQIKSTVLSGLKTEIVQEKDYQYLIYVNANTDGFGNGEKKNPFQSITDALNYVSDKKITGKIAILVAKGEYHETTIQMKPGIDLYGGFNIADWKRNIEEYKTILNAENGHRVIDGADNSKIDGFIITGGRIKGTGAGINCSGVSPIISNNVFMNNHTLGPQNWNPKYWHETANNGGAVYCENGSQAIIRNCVFINNSTENGRGAGIAADNKCKLLIRGNVFIDNIAGIKDPMRSSDGGAISIFNWCKAEITHNIFLSNKTLNHNDGGGVFVALWSSAKINENIFVNNVAGDDGGSLFVGGQEHHYGGAPLDPIPATKDFSVDISNNLFLGNKNLSMNSGVMRFTMESKGSYTNNISALNSGIYFQRSEVAVKENIILDNFLFIETKKGLLPGEITNNLIWGDFLLDVNPYVSGNRIKGKLDSQGKQYRAPEFVNDGQTVPIISLNVDKKMFKTELLIAGDGLKKNSLVNRVIRSGENWGVVLSNSESEIMVWGNLGSAETIQLLPSYTIKNNFNPK